MDIAILTNSFVSKLKAYTPGRSIASVKKALGLSSIIKLASNENPYGASVSAHDLSSCMNDIHLYPDISNSGLIESLASTLNVNPEHIILGNGSDEILQLLATCFLKPDDEVLTVNHTFSVYKFVATIAQAQYKTVPLKQFTFDVASIVNAITPKTKLLFLANPNNPTGSILTTDEIEQILSHLPNGILVLDQAYADFVDESDYCNGLSLIKKYNNVCVLQTFSKLYGLAGLRVGYGVGHEDMISAMQKLRMPFNLNSPALTAATLALSNKAFVQKTLQNNTTEKHRLYKAFDNLGMAYVPSQGNFVMFYGDFEATDVYDWFLKKGIILRPLNSFGIPNGIRVTIGTHEQMTIFIKELHTYFYKGD